MKNKVYCQNCKWYRFYWGDSPEDTYCCTNPMNTNKKDTWLKIEYNRKYPAYKINKNNNCKWYEPIEDK